MMEIRKKDNQIWIGDKHYNFKQNIEKIAVFPKIIVLMFWKQDEVQRNNIIAIDYEGRVCWNISDINKLNYAEAYVTLSKEEDNIISVTSYNGVKIYINVDTKQIIKKKITK